MSFGQDVEEELPRAGPLGGQVGHQAVLQAHVRVADRLDLGRASPRGAGSGGTAGAPPGRAQSSTPRRTVTNVSLRKRVAMRVAHRRDLAGAVHAGHGQVDRAAVSAPRRAPGPCGSRAGTCGRHRRTRGPRWASRPPGMPPSPDAPCRRWRRRSRRSWRWSAGPSPPPARPRRSKANRWRVLGEEDAEVRRRRADLADGERVAEGGRPGHVEVRRGEVRGRAPVDLVDPAVLRAGDDPVGPTGRSPVPTATENASGPDRTRMARPCSTTRSSQAWNEGVERTEGHATRPATHEDRARRGAHAGPPPAPAGPRWHRRP